MSLNRYGYVQANVVNATDPLGLFVWDYGPYQQGGLTGGHVEYGDCLYCIGREAGQAEEDLEAFAWNVSSLPVNMPLFYRGPDGKKNRLAHPGDHLAIPVDLVKSYPGKKCPGDCLKGPQPTLLPQLTPSPTIPITPTCTATPGPTIPVGGLNCKPYMGAINSVGFVVASGSIYAIGGAGGSVFAMWDAAHIGSPDHFLLLYSVEAGFGGEFGFKALKQISNFWHDLAGHDAIFSEATLNQLSGLSGNFSASLLVVHLGASVSNNPGGCPRISGTGGTELGTVGAHVSVGSTDVIFDSRTGEWWPNAWYVQH